jgi:hypothetical protein
MLGQPRIYRRDLARIAEFDQEMEMVGHQAILQELETESVAAAPHEVKERATILVIGEDRFPIGPGSSGESKRPPAPFHPW